MTDGLTSTQWERLRVWMVTSKAAITGKPPGIIAVAARSRLKLPIEADHIREMAPYAHIDLEPPPDYLKSLSPCVARDLPVAY